MAYLNPSVDDFKTRFTRDFPYGMDPTIAVLDSDIAQAFVDTNSINQGLFADQGTYTNAYLLLAAHNLVQNIRMSSQGLNSGAFTFLEQSKSVGALAQSFGIPERILENPELAFLCTTPYGAKYLASIMPLLTGQIFTVCGSTRP